jgi:hypothetical protein
MYMLYEPVLATKIRAGEKKNTRKCGILWHYVALPGEIGRMQAQEKKASAASREQKPSRNSHAKLSLGGLPA